MPPKAKITREMVIDAAFDIARIDGADRINARSIAHKLGCSTQPILYCFHSVDEIKKAVYEKADEFHSAYIMPFSDGAACDDPMLTIGLAYIRFGHCEKNLFRLLFQSDEFSGQDLSALIDDERLSPILGILSQSAGASHTQAKDIFRSIFLFVHGYASMLANNSMDYDENVVSEDMQRVFRGVLREIREEE